MSEEMKKDEALAVLADYIVNNNINYVGGEFEREDTKECFMVVVSKESALKNLTETIAKQAERINRLESLAIQVVAMNAYTKSSIPDCLIDNANRLLSKEGE